MRRISYYITFVNLSSADECTDPKKPTIPSWDHGQETRNSEGGGLQALRVAMRNWFESEVKPV